MPTSQFVTKRPSGRQRLPLWWRRHRGQPKRPSAAPLPPPWPTRTPPPPGVVADLVALAVAALLQHVTGRAAQVGSGEEAKAALVDDHTVEPVSIILSIKLVPDRPRMRFIIIPLSTALHNPGDAEVCLIVKGP